MEVLKQEDIKNDSQKRGIQPALCSINRRLSGLPFRFADGND